MKVKVIVMESYDLGFNLERECRFTFRNHFGVHDLFLDGLIDSTLTPLNIDWFIETSRPIYDVISERLTAVGSISNPIDGGLLGFFTHQPNPVIFKDLDDLSIRIQFQRFIEDVKDYLEGQYGADSVIAYSGHMDEVHLSPHVHFWIMPVTEDVLDYMVAEHAKDDIGKNYFEYMTALGWIVE